MSSFNIYVHQAEDKIPGFIAVSEQDFTGWLSQMNERDEAMLDRMEMLLLEDFMGTVESIYVHNFRPLARSLHVRVIYTNGKQEYPTLNSWTLDRMSEKVDTTAEKVAFLLHVMKEKYGVDAEDPRVLGFQIGQEAGIFSDRTSAESHM